ncbi:MAG: polysaccharide biosynthesis/export family protein [Candidatus Aminicenantes bacterium]|nr:polysaccharide biosynthesis/export family protein [Candidatus Aminicenantes bacterium]
MKRLTLKTLGILIILAFISCATSKDIHLIDMTTKESPSETELILTTTDPVPYKETKLENPPGIIISFPGNKVFCSEKDELIINKGPIKKIKNEYYEKEGKGQRWLNFLVVELSKDIPYTISQSGSSIIIRMENLTQSPNAAKEKIEPKPQFSDKTPSLELGYLIGPDDVLHIEVWQHPDVSGDVRVNYKGEIRVPPIKSINVMGLPSYQVEEKLAEALSKYLIDPVVYVSVKEYNSQRVIAIGETTTGMYTLKRRTTLVEFLGQIGGTKENADIFRIKLIKKDGETYTYDLNKLINYPQKSNEVLVSGGDTVYVPPLEINKVYILGEVRTPKVINIKGKLSLVEAVIEAGGYTDNAITSSILVIRGELGSQKGIRLNLSRILKKGDIAQNIDLKPGDIVYVPRTFIASVERFLRIAAAPITWYVWFLK